MTKRARISVGLLLAACFGVCAWQLLRPRERYPVFEGRRLSEWLNHHVASTAAVPPYGSPGWQKADDALRSIGTNGIPTLLSMIAAKDLPRPMLKLLEFGRSRGWLRMDYRYAYARHEEAEYAFRVLGPSASNAVPGLIKVYEANVSASSQMNSALALGSIGAAAQSALPTLMRNFTHTNGDVRFYAVSAVIRILGEPGIIIPAFTKTLKDPKVEVRWNALVGLSMFGGKARVALPEILGLLEDKSVVGGSPIREQVETTLWRIAPERIGNPFVVEEATPLVADGVTTQALKVTFYDKRQTLIPAGERTPTVAQYWSSDPRPSLTLYRGESATSGGEYCLGKFEVLDLPAKEQQDDLNVSTLCVIADGRIFLCARDNRRNQFLGIRRLPDEAQK